MCDPDLLPLQQSPGYAAALRHLGRDVTDIDAGEGPPILMLRRRVGPTAICYTPRADLRGTRRSALRNLPRRHFRIIVPEDCNPTGLRPSLRNGLPILTPQHVAELTLSGPGADDLWRGMHGKWRNRLRRALDGPLTVRESPLEYTHHAPLLHLEQTQRVKRDYSSYPLGFLAAYAETAKDQTCLIRARLNGETLAFMLFLIHGAVATYAIGWTGAEGRRTHAHNLLMWHAMTGFRDRGIRRIDLGSLDTDRGRSLARFKLGCGARARPLGPTLLIPPGVRALA